jgi:Glyoxalase-like domain
VISVQIFLIEAAEDGEHVGPADDADEMPARVDHGELPDPVLVHQPGRVLDRFLGGDGYRRACHQIPCGYPARLLLIFVVEDAGDVSPQTVLVVDQGFFGQHVGLRDDVDDLDATEARVLAAGATKYDVQPNDHCRVYADPVGHPFCLSTLATADLRQS